jgi:hypothetical protein
VSLQGSLDAFALADVLALLASTKKTGELSVRAPAGAGFVWFDDGQVAAAEAGSSTDPIDSIFQLLRLDEGTFSFEAGPAVSSDGLMALEPLVAEAQGRLEEWRVIEAVVPSLATRVRLAPELPGRSQTVDAYPWRVLVAVAEGGAVAAVAERLGLGEFAACREVKTLVDAGLVAVEGRRPVEPARSAAGGPEAAGDNGAAEGDPGSGTEALALARQLARLGPAGGGGADGGAEEASPPA